MTREAVPLERVVQDAVLGEVGSRSFLRIWRQNTGAAVPLSIVRQALALLGSQRLNDAHDLLARARVIAFGVNGGADLSGLYACGKRIEFECKRPGFPPSAWNEDQRRFASMIRKLGGTYETVTSAEEAATYVDDHAAACDVCRKGVQWGG